MIIVTYYLRFSLVISFLFGNVGAHVWVVLSTIEYVTKYLTGLKYGTVIKLSTIHRIIKKHNQSKFYYL